MSNTGQFPVLVPGSDPSSPNERSPGSAEDEIEETVVPDTRIIWVAPDQFPPVGRKSRTRNALAIIVAIGSVVNMTLASIGILFFSITVEHFLLITGATVSILALTRVIGWYFARKDDGRR